MIANSVHNTYCTSFMYTIHTMQVLCNNNCLKYNGIRNMFGRPKLA